MNTAELQEILFEAANAKDAGLTLRVDQGEQRRRTFRLIGVTCQIFHSEYISEIKTYIEGYSQGRKRT